ncbi:hypothetical protein TRFO_02902 [Tritrichomonas foetus]|uniref:Uncharacterized protein n=1 Tax=Tritrichomonas foetus TaxID=1144522 RepID=A0A1J4L0T1_9EUKA|nr:hypothetical protein TRFO_02902 [Tritrichomonas foetus]|eukprot:OHT15556.1 hypothetical protein TRFO_02902 [Tritrichomonas foetus]
MNISNESESSDLNDVPLEIDQNDFSLFIDENSIKYSFSIFIMIILFNFFFCFLCYACIQFISSNKIYSKTLEFQNVTLQSISFYFSELPTRNVNFQIKMKFNSKETIDFKCLFNISLSKTKSIFSYQDLHTNAEKFIINTNVANIDYINLTMFDSNSPLFFNSVTCTLYTSIYASYYFNLFSNLFFIAISSIFLIFHLRKFSAQKEIIITQYLSSLFVLLCLLYEVTSLIQTDRALLFQQIAEILLKTFFIQMTFSFLLISFDFIHINIIESFFDFFLSILIMLYSLSFYILILKQIKLKKYIYYLQYIFCIFYELLRNYIYGAH